jgi:hypothetical protein
LAQTLNPSADLTTGFMTDFANLSILPNLY